MTIEDADAIEKERERNYRAIFSSFSHDLKTPLSCIIGSLEIYERTRERLSPEKQQTLINTALQEAQRLDAFITQLLAMAKLDTVPDSSGSKDAIVTVTFTI